MGQTCACSKSVLAGKIRPVTLVWRRDPFPSFTCGRGRKSGLVSLAPWTCALPRAELSNGHDSIIRELKSTASKNLVASSACTAESMLIWLIFLLILVWLVKV